MADGEDIQPLVCDNGTGMVKVFNNTSNQDVLLGFFFLKKNNVFIAGWFCWR